MPDTKWQNEALRMRTNNIDAIAEAHVDAGVYGSGWLKVDVNGYLTRINPLDIVITVKALNREEAE